MVAGTDEAGHAFQFEAGHSDRKPAVNRIVRFDDVVCVGAIRPTASGAGPLVTVYALLNFRAAGWVELAARH